jgi:hypothetical protein
LIPVWLITARVLFLLLFYIYTPAYAVRRERSMGTVRDTYARKAAQHLDYL